MLPTPCSTNKVSLILSLAAALFSATSCSEPAKVAGFDEAAWKADPGGCKGTRARFWDGFKANKVNLLGYDENDMPYLLGPPDSKNLMERGQKMYSYYISGSPKCTGNTTTAARVLQVRVNATGIISEVQEQAAP